MNSYFPVHFMLHLCGSLQNLNLCNCTDFIYKCFIVWVYKGVYDNWFVTYCAHLLCTLTVHTYCAPSVHNIFCVGELWASLCVHVLPYINFNTYTLEAWTASGILLPPPMQYTNFHAPLFWPDCILVSSSTLLYGVQMTLDCDLILSHCNHIWPGMLA